MKNLFRILLAVVVLGGAGAAGVVGWHKYQAWRDPMAKARALLTRGDVHGAQLELRDLLQGQPDNGQAHFMLGQIDLVTGDPVSAEKNMRIAQENGVNPAQVAPLLARAYLQQGKYETVLKEFPTDRLPPAQAVPMTVLRATALLGLNRGDEAQQSLDQAEKLMPNAVEVPLAAARVAMVRNDYALAQEKIARALAIDGRQPDALLLKGQLANLRGDRTEALAALDAALAVQPKMIAARLERANTYLGMGQDDKARADVDQALVDQPRSAAGIYLQGVLFTRARKYTEADAAFEKINTIMGNFPRAYFFAAIVKYNLGQAEQARDDAVRYVARNPADPDGIKLLARIELVNRRPDRAVDVLSQAVNAGRADADMLDLLGRAYSLVGQQAMAAQSFQQAVSLAPNNAEILTRLASTKLGMGDAVGATGTLEKSLEIAPNQGYALEALVVAALAAGELDKADATLAKLREIEPNSEAVGNLAGLVLMSKMDLDGAQKQFADTIKAYPQSMQARMNMARALVMQGRLADAERVLTEALQYEPANESALTQLLGILLPENRLPTAIAVVEQARVAAPVNAGLTTALADLYIRAGQADKALPMLDQARKGAPADTALMAARARALLALKRPDEARDAYRSLINQSPTDLSARLQLVALLTAANDIEGAKAQLRDGLKAQPGQVDLLENAVALEFHTTGLDAALAMAASLESNPANLPAAHMLKGDAYMLAKKFPEAAAAYAAAVQQDNTGMLVLRAAAAFSEAGKPDDGTKMLQAWLAAHPEDLDAASMLATMDIAAGRLRDAQAHLELVLTRRSSDPATLNNLAWVYAQLGDPRARQLALKAYLLGPGAETADTLGWILARGSEADKGLTLLRQAAAMQPNDPSIQYHLAYALNATGDRDAAVETLRKLGGDDRNFPEKADAHVLLAKLTTH